MKYLLPLLVALTLSAPARAEISLPALLSDGCVLQRHTEVRLWGQATPDKRLKITPSWTKPVKTRADKQGHWEVMVPTGAAGGPHSFTVSGDGEHTVNDILFGEVWVASGQSNMAWTMAQCGYPPRILEEADRPTLRLFTVPRRTALEPMTVVTSEWQRCTPETAKGFSATAYWFGLELQRRFGIPVGLIHSSWGGTPAEAWTPEEALANHPRLAVHLERKRDHFTPPDGEQLAHKRQLFDLQTQKQSPGYGMQAKAEWAQPAFDDSDWSSQALPARFSDIGLEDFDGGVWFRRSLDLPASAEGAPAVLLLEPINDMDEVWVNGHRIGRTLIPRPRLKRTYQIPEELLVEGPNTLTIRVIDQASVGAVGTPKGQVGTLKIGDEAIALDGEWKYRQGAALKDLPQWPREKPPRMSHCPTALYNGMIHPLLPYTIRGAIWYQGESNRNRGAEYHVLFPTMVDAWRKAWGQGDFPFYYVQIAPYKYDGKHTSAEVREAQRLTLSIPHTGMAVITDIANENDIHPKNKHDVGERLARWALYQTYGVSSVVPSGPLFREVEAKGAEMVLHFDWAEGLRVPPGESPTEFVIAGKDREWKPAEARIEGQTVVVSHPEVPAPEAVRFGWADYSVPNLTNGDKLPASPFRTDDDPLSDDQF